LAHENPAFFGGFLSDWPVLITRTFYCCLSFILLMLYTLTVKVILPDRAPMFKLAFAIYLTGVMGNMIDRFFRGFVMDFFGIVFSPDLILYLNFADLILLTGAILFLYSLYKESDVIWNPVERRKIHFFSTIQKNIIFFLLFINSALFILISIFTFTFVDGFNVQNFSYKFFFLGQLFVFIIFQILTTTLGIICGSRIVGPIHALGIWLKGPRSAPLKLREADYFKLLETMSAEIMKIESSKKNNSDK
jgi:hypothetical protein